MFSAQTLTAPFLRSSVLFVILKHAIAFRFLCSIFDRTDHRTGKHSHSTHACRRGHEVLADRGHNGVLLRRQTTCPVMNGAACQEYVLMRNLRSLNGGCPASPASPTFSAFSALPLPVWVWVRAPTPPLRICAISGPSDEKPTSAARPQLATNSFHCPPVMRRCRPYPLPSPPQHVPTGAVPFLPEPTGANASANPSALCAAEPTEARPFQASPLEPIERTPRRFENQKQCQL